MNKWDLDACIHCGKCTRSCLFLEKYGIDLPVLKEKPELAYHCFLCGTCGCVCPKGIDGKEIALDSRRKLVEVTPKNIRLRKKILNNKDRERMARRATSE